MSHSNPTVRIHFCQVQHRIRLCQSCLYHGNRQSTNSNILLCTTWWLDDTGRHTWYCTTGNASVLSGKIFCNTARCFFILTLIQLPEMWLLKWIKNMESKLSKWIRFKSVFEITNEIFLTAGYYRWKMVIWFGGSNYDWPSSVRHLNEGHKYKIIPDEWLF